MVEYTRLKVYNSGIKKRKHTVKKLLSALLTVLVGVELYMEPDMFRLIVIFMMIGLPLMACGICLMFDTIKKQFING